MIDALYDQIMIDVLNIVANLQQWEIMSWHDMRCQKACKNVWWAFFLSVIIQFDDFWKLLNKIIVNGWLVWMNKD